MSMFLNISFLIVFTSALAPGFKTLAKPLAPLPEREYPRILNSPRTKQKLPVKLLCRGLAAGQMTVRARSAMLLGDQGHRSSVPYLIDTLSDQSRHDGANYPEAGMATTRYWANESLKKLTQQDFGFAWNDPEEDRNKAIARWRTWYLSISKSKR